MPALTKRTEFPYPTFTQFSLYRSLRVVDGAIVPQDSVSAVKGTVQILGDEAGVPLQELPATLGVPQFGMVQPDLSEVVTRSDGTKLTVQELLAEIVLATE
jgi:hypothetical protein